MVAVDPLRRAETPVLARAAGPNLQVAHQPSFRRATGRFLFQVELTIDCCRSGTAQIEHRGLPLHSQGAGRPLLLRNRGWGRSRRSDTSLELRFVTSPADMMSATEFVLGILHERLAHPDRQC